MSILIINASPRKNGNSSFIANELMKKYEDEAEIINLRDLKLLSCTSCKSCRTNNSLCVIKDDLVDIYPKLLSADKIIFLSPNIMGFMSSLAKIFTDRFYCLKDSNKKSRFEEGKKVIFVLTQGSPNREHGETTLRWGKSFFESYGLKTFTMLIPNCAHDNFDGVKIKLDELKMNISMF